LEELWNTSKSVEAVVLLVNIQMDVVVLGVVVLLDIHIGFGVVDVGVAGIQRVVGLPSPWPVAAGEYIHNLSHEAVDMIDAFLMQINYYF
jgi:hypothetical protein